MNDFAAEPVVRGRLVAVSAFLLALGPEYYRYHGANDVAAALDALLRDLAQRGAARRPGRVFDLSVRAGRKSVKLSVVMPVYNEAKTVREIVRRVLDVPIDKEMIIVDDGSTDGTRDILRDLDGKDGIRVFLQPVNQGKGAAVRTDSATPSATSSSSRTPTSSTTRTSTRSCSRRSSRATPTSSSARASSAAARTACSTSGTRSATGS